MVSFSLHWNELDPHKSEYVLLWGGHFLSHPSATVSDGVTTPQVVSF